MPVDDLAPKYKRFEFRRGVGGFPGWEGMERDGDAISIANNRPRLVVNGRFRNGQIEARRSQIKHNLTVLDPANCRSVFDQQIDRPISLFVMMAGCPGGVAGAVGTAGISCCSYNPEQEPQFQRNAYYIASLVGANMSVFDTKTYLSVDNELKRFNYVLAPYGTEVFSVSGLLQERPVHTFTNPISGLKAFDGKLFIAEANGASSKIWTFDGLTLTDDTGGVFSADPTGFGLYRDLLIVGYGAAANKISFRRVGESGSAVWTDVAGATEGLLEYGIEYKDKFYFTGGGDDVWVYDGTAIASALNIAGATFGTLEVANGFLYATYTSGGVGRLARYDGSAWTNAHKSFTGQLETASRIAWFRNSLHVYGQTDIANGLHDIFTSPNVNTSGTYTSMSDLGDLVFRQVLKMVRID